jgi:ADP-heptose:LPS heptosyltransferase
VGRARTVKPSRLRRALWIVRDVLFLAADSLVLGLLRRKPPASAGGQPKVAIVAAHGIGDLVLLLPALEALLRRYSDARYRVTLVCSTAAEDFARSVVSVDAIIGIDRVRLRRDLVYRLQIVRRLRGGNFSIAVQPSFNRDLLVEDALMRATGAPTRIGSVGTAMFMPPRARRLGDRWYSQLIPAAGGVLHDLARNAEFMRGLDPAGAPLRLGRRLQPQRSPQDPPYMLFVVGSSSPIKSWPLAHFEWLANALAARSALPIVFCAGARDALGPPSKAPRPISRPSHAELMGLIAGARLVVCNDSAAAHLAAALRVPAVCVVGGGIVGRYHPYPLDQAFDTSAPVAVGLAAPMPCFDCGWRCRFRIAPGEPAPCVEAVEPARVLAATLALLQPS